MSSLFKQRLNKILTDAELPEEDAERVEAFAKIFDLKRHEANAILNNGKIPDEALLKRIASEFEVKLEWLSEKTASNKK
jgi:transcriptional regulator with XRE-family HTH domain